MHILVEGSWERGRVSRCEPRGRKICVTYKDKNLNAVGDPPPVMITEWISETEWATEVRPTDTDSDDDSNKDDTGADSHTDTSKAQTVSTALSAATEETNISEAVEEQRLAGERFAEASRRVAGLVRARGSPTSGGNPCKRTAKSAEGNPDRKKSKGKGAGKGVRAAPSGTIRSM